MPRIVELCPATSFRNYNGNISHIKAFVFLERLVINYSFISVAIFYAEGSGFQLQTYIVIVPEAGLGGWTQLNDSRQNILKFI